MLMDYVAFSLSERSMREQFEYQREPAAPQREQQIPRIRFAPLRRGAATLLRQIADRLEPGRPAPLGADGIISSVICMP